MRTTPAPFRRLAAVATLALVATTAAACSDDEGSGGSGGSGGSDGGDATTQLTQEQVEQVALTEENVGDGFTREETPDENDNGDGPGCLGEVGAITDGIEEAADINVEYSYGDAGVPLVQSGASSFDDEAEFVDAFDQVKEILSGCTTITGTDENGLAYDLTVTYDDTAAEGVDDQVHVEMTGTLSAEGDEATISQAITMARIGPNVVTLGMVDYGAPETIAAFGTYEQIGLDRFVAVVNGDEPAETTAPAPE